MRLYFTKNKKDLTKTRVLSTERQLAHFLKEVGSAAEEDFASANALHRLLTGNNMNKWIFIREVMDRASAAVAGEGYFRNGLKFLYRPPQTSFTPPEF